jgi:hypothetical protein
MTGSPPGKKVSASQVLREVLTPKQRMRLLAIIIEADFWPESQREENELAQVIRDNWNGR